MQKAKLYSGHWAPFFMAILCFTAVLHFHNTVFAESPAKAWICPAAPDTEERDYTDAEEWVCERISKGKLANLRAKFADEKDRVLSPGFLKALFIHRQIFLGDVEEDRQVVQIMHAVLTDPVDLKGEKVLHEVELTNCQFEDDADFSESTFHKPVSFVNTSFKTVDFTDAVFKARANFNEIKVGNTANFTRAKFNSFASVSFNGITVRGDANFYGAQFKGPVYFSDANINEFSAKHAQFGNPEGVSRGVASFSGITVRGDADFSSATFAGAVSFIRAEITGSFNAWDAQFTSPSLGPNFNEIKVGDQANFARAKFVRGMTFSGANIRQFNAQHARFNEASFANLRVEDWATFDAAVFEARANFDGMHVGNKASFQEVEFKGLVSFIRAEITGKFDAQQAQFKSPVFFDRITVRGDAHFYDAQFEGLVSFSRAEITGKFYAQQAQFTSQSNFSEIKVGNRAIFDAARFEERVTFNGANIREFAALRVGTQTSFDAPVFSGPVDMKQATFSDVHIQGNSEQGNSLTLDLSQTAIRSGFKIEDANLELMTARFLRVEGQTTLKGLKITEANFEHSTFQHLLLCNISSQDVPSDPKLFKLYGMTYQHIQLVQSKEEGEENAEECLKPDADALVNLIQKAEYRPSIYTNLEAFFQRQGDFKTADSVFLSQQSQKRTEAWRRLWQGEYSKVIELLWSYLLLISVHDGRSPEWAFGWSIAILYLGFWVFREKDGMDPQKPEELLFSTPASEFSNQLDTEEFLEELKQKFKNNGISLSHSVDVTVKAENNKWQMRDKNNGKMYMIVRQEQDRLNFYSEEAYSAVWYSLDLFLPFIDLQVASAWTPKKDRRGALRYMRSHIILGWLLVPIGLAALTGIIK